MSCKSLFASLELRETIEASVAFAEKYAIESDSSRNFVFQWRRY